MKNYSRIKAPLINWLLTTTILVYILYKAAVYGWRDSYDLLATACSVNFFLSSAWILIVTSGSSKDTKRNDDSRAGGL